MTENNMRVRLPTLPDPAFFKKPEASILTEGGLALLTYDPVTRAGFLYLIAAETWSIAAPIAFEEFAVMVAAAGYRLPDSPDARRWVNACLGPDATKPIH